MSRIQNFSFLPIIIALVFSGCSRHDEPLSTFYPANSERTLVAPGVYASTVTLGGYDITFDGRTFANSQTTFSYTLTDVGGGTSISQFALELPACAPDLAGSSPGGGEPDVISQTGFYSIKWGNIGISSGGSASFSITFPGDVPLGYVHVQLKASSDYEVAVVRGPCGGFVISGVVFADADGDESQRVSAEPGIPNVTVTLVDGSDTETTTTDATGGYSFLRPEGNYTVRIDMATTQTDFNEELAESFDPSTPLSRAVTVGPDSPGNDFGFTPQVGEIITELETGVLLTDGESLKYWIAQVRSAAKGGKGKSDYTVAEIEGFVAQIQGLFLPDPFVFTPGNELMEALDILKDRSKGEVAELTRELLASEFNQVSGKGLLGENELQKVLLSWVESIIAQSDDAPPALLFSTKGGDDGPLRVLRLPYTESLEMLRLLNGATGGGGGGEG